MSAGLWAGSQLLGVPIGRTATLVLALAFAAPIGLVRAGGEKARVAGPALRALRGLALAITALVVAALLVDASANPLTDFDGRMTWGAQARFIAGEGTASPRALREAPYSVAHPRYPVLMPIAQAALGSVAGAGDDDRVVRPLHVLFFVAFVLVVLVEGTRLAGAWPGALAGLAAATVPYAAFAVNGGARGAYSDLPLGVFWGAGLALLVAHRVERSTAVAGGLFLAFALLTKSEGLPLAGAALVAVALPRLSRGHVKDVALAAVPPILGALLLAAWHARIPARFDEDYLAALTPRALLHGLSTNGAAIARAVGARLARSEAWGLLFLAAPLVLLAGGRAFRRARTVSLVLALAGALAVYLAAYALTPPDRLAELMEVTWDRFVVQMLVPALLLIAGAARECLRRRSRAFLFDSSTRLPQRPYPGDRFVVVVVVEEQGLVLEGRLRHEAVDRAPDGQAAAATLEVDPRGGPMRGQRTPNPIRGWVSRTAVSLLHSRASRAPWRTSWKQRSGDGEGEALGLHLTQPDGGWRSLSPEQVYEDRGIDEDHRRARRRALWS